MNETSDQLVEGYARAQVTEPEPTQRECDVIMKGGITSGVVYPGALFELAKEYTFRNIGGTSAGAIAAAGIAAAELGRHKARATNPARQMDSFEQLAKIPRWLGGRAQSSSQSNLFSLFQPQAATRPLFNTLTAFLGKNEGKWQRVVLAALQNFVPPALLGALPGVILLLLILFTSPSALLAVWGIVASLLMIVVGAALATAAALGLRAWRAIPQNYFGLCTGSPEAAAKGQPKSLTYWLSDLLDDLAGVKGSGKPLTFADLWDTDDENAPRRINLEMITTCLSHNRPYRLPFSNRIFLFDVADMQKFFPPAVVEWMVAKSYRDPAARYVNGEGKELYGLPAPADLPVVVATRMSLSFPILLSAVPLYAVDWTREANIAVEEARERAAQSTDQVAAPPTVHARKCWFSDGGITSNLPVHFFDNPLPRRPTFAINLRNFHPDHPRQDDESRNIWMPANNAAGIRQPWTYFDDKPTYGQLLAFLGVIVDTSRSWSDELQLLMPGYRDRVVHVNVDDDEGGLNLNMPDCYIERLSKRGEFAGKELVRRFADPNTQHPLSWDNHRWVRFRQTMTMTEKLLDVIRQRFDEKYYGQRSYRELIRRGPNELPNSYRWENLKQQEFAENATDQLFEVARNWHELGAEEQSLADGAPKPRSEWQVRPLL